MNDSSYPEWQLEIPIAAKHFPFEYKFIVRDKSSSSNNTNNDTVIWEHGPNRVCGLDASSAPPACLILREGRFRGEPVPKRMAGVAIPVFSLRTQRSLGCGEFVDLAVFADWAKV